MKEVIFQPLRNRRLSETIEQSIKDLILTGQLEVGSRLPTEVEIGRQFGVSVVTVREALRGLEAFGVIEKKRGKDGGIFVARTKSDIVKNAMHAFMSPGRFSALDLSELRVIVEPATVALAASKITDDELKTLEENIRYCENKLEKERKRNRFSEKSFFDIEERNVEFHRLVAEATHNPFLILTIDYVMDFLLGLKKATLNPDVQFSARSVTDHRNVLDALRKGDAETSERLMREHLRIVDGYLIDRGDKSSTPKCRQSRESS